MDPVSISLGVVGLVPVIVQVIKAFRDLQAGVKTARKCGQKLKDLRFELQVQEHRFLNECVLLLHASCEDKKSTQDMVSDPNHGNWADKSLNARLRRRLQQSYSVCLILIEHIFDDLQSLVADLQGFSEVESLKTPDEDWKKTFRRVQESIQFSFDKSTFEKKINILRKRNTDLESLRSQHDLLGQSTCTSRCSSRKPLPLYFTEVQRVSEEAYCALTASFTCSDKSHGQHSASLCLDIERVDNVCLSMAITSSRSTADTDNFEAPVRFLLQSKAVEQSSTLVQQDNSGMNDSVEAESIETENKSNQRPKIEGKMTASSSSIMKMKRKRKVMFADEVEVPERGAKLVATASSSNLNSSTTGSGPSINLCAIKSACEYLRQHCGCPEAVTTYGYFAYFQKRTLSKYIFYVSANHLVSHESTTSLSSYNMSLHDFLLAEQEETVTNVHQFKLALKLALAVLQYHSTPWLRGEWRLSQLMLTTDPSRLPDHFTLYLNSSLIPTPPTPPTTPEASIHNEVQMIEAPKKGRLSEAQRRGINNTTLFCLGLALLEISHWKQLSSLIEDYDTDEIDTARRLSNSNSVLGRRYDEIVRKCLQCNFGFGTDLGRTELQSAVYSDVVCPLEELIEKLDDLSI